MPAGFNEITSSLVCKIFVALPGFSSAVSSSHSLLGDDAPSSTPPEIATPPVCGGRCRSYWTEDQTVSKQPVDIVNLKSVSVQTNKQF